MEPVNTIPLKSGLQTGVDSLSNGVQVLSNFLIDSAGINRVRPGMAEYTVAGLTGKVIGMVEWRGDLIVVTSDRRLWRILLAAPDHAIALSSLATATSLLDGSKTPVFAGDSQRLIIAGGGALQQWNGVASSRLVTSGTYPPSASSHVVALANYIIANDTNTPDQFHWSDIGDAAHGTWNALSYTTADARPDRIVAMAENTRELLVWGEQTLQVYGVGDDYLLPFQAVATLNVGCGAPYSPIRLDENFAWLDERRRFVLSSGHESPQVISRDIDKTLKDLPRVDDCWGARIDVGYWNLALWVFPSARTAFVYDYARNYWTNFNGQDGIGNLTELAAGAYCYWAAMNQHMVGSLSGTPSLGTLSLANVTDWGTPIVAVRQTGWMNFGTDRRKRLTRLRETMRRGGTGAAADSLETRMRLDAGTWTTPQRINLGTLADTEASEMVRDLYPGGLFRRALLEFRYSGTTPEFALADVELHAQECSS